MVEIMEIETPVHQQPLKLVPVGSEDDDGQTRRRECAGCDDEMSGEVYACDSCKLYLHQSCANLPLRIEHFIHPGCHLFLKIVLESEDHEEAMGMTKLWYQCETCNFGVDAACGLKFLQPNNIEEVNRLYHPHPLRLYVGERDEGSSSEEEEDAKPKCCRGCDKLISGKCYVCNLGCDYYLHESCLEQNLPSKIRHFFHPSCTLYLTAYKTISWGSFCQACRIYPKDDYLYRCERCNFNMHVECAKFQPVGSEDEGTRIQHWSHHHPLDLSGKAEQKEVLGGYISCNLCRDGEISRQCDYAACEPCQFYIHKSCMDLPREIQHRCHPYPHPLKLKYAMKDACYTCSGSGSLFCYQSEKCSFNMCVDCMLFSDEVSQGDNKAEHRLHFCHHHPLQLFKDPKKDKSDMFARRKLECPVCRSSASGLTYGCKDCDVYLHKSCLDILPQTIHTEYVSLFLYRGTERNQRCTKCMKSILGLYFKEMRNEWDKEMWCVPCALLEVLSHRVVSPSFIFSQLHFHPCTLTLKLFPTFTCNACFTNCHTHAYYCDQCDFYVGIRCAEISMQSSEGDGKEWIQHFCHWHPLQVSQDTEEDSTTCCQICGSCCTPKPFYFCSACDFHIHKSCLDILSLKIDQHYFRCSLVLLTTSSHRCIACQKENSSGLAFRSIQRGFKLCLKCVIWPENKQNDDGTFTSIHHWHQLTLIVERLETDANCLLCRSNVSTSTYYCSECKDYFHKACAELPLVVQQHPLHRQHSLTLISSHQLPESSRNCSLCQGDLLLFDDPESHHSGVYHCKECGFQLDKKCFTGFPSIQYQGHPHLLTVVENMQGEEACHVCSASCKNDMVFRCAEVECKFSLHLYCGPLPCNIKHSCHVHSLVLEDFYVEENYTDLFPCHFCEKRRDPRLAVYCCIEGCPMICDIKCVISEVMPKLLGADGEVELRTTFPNVVSKVITKDEGLIDITYDSSSRFIFDDCGDLLPKGALEFLLLGMERDDIWSITKSWEDIMGRSHGLQLEREDDDMFTFTREAFDHFSSKLEFTQFILRGEGIPKFITQHSGSAVRGEFILPETLIPIYEEWFGQYNSNTTETSRQRQYRSFFVFMLCTVLHNMRTTKLVDVTNERVLQWLTLLKLLEEAGFRISFISDNIKRVWEAHFLIKAKAIVDDKSARLDRRHKELFRREEKLLRELEDVRKDKEAVKKEEQVHHKYAGDGMRSLRKEYADALLIKWKPSTVTILDSKDQLSDELEHFRMHGKERVPGENYEDPYSYFFGTFPSPSLSCLSSSGDPNSPPSDY